MYKYTLLKHYGTLIVAIVVTIWCIWKTIKKENLISITCTKSTEYKINVVIKIMLSIMLIIIHIGGTIPSIQDIPYIFHNDLKRIEGVAVSSDKSKSDADWYLRSFVIQSEEDKVKVLARTRQVELGDYFEVRYLPHTHLGEVISRE